MFANFLTNASGILNSWRDNSSFKCYTLGPLCLWQCFLQGRKGSASTSTATNARLIQFTITIVIKIRIIMIIIINDEIIQETLVTTKSCTNCDYSGGALKR